ncbi:SDR family oxidoreductase [Oceanobacillus sp. CF4.6]
MNEKFLSQVPVGRAGTIEEVASLAHFLGRKDSGFINGAVVNISGGMHMS